MHVSVVIPTYNRGPKLAATLHSILQSDATGLESVEVIVVDDGSPQPAEPVVASCRAEHPFSLRCIRQPNAGPAAARNRGFRESGGGIVLFMDDDILCPPTLIRDHVAARGQRPGSVICGRCVLAPPAAPSALFRYVDSLGNDPGKDAQEEFLEVPIVASGQLSVERSQFEGGEGVYRSDLATPAAEEYELSSRLRQRGIPILLATRIVAVHDHPLELEGMCRQAYKHAKGCAEAALKCRSTGAFEEAARVVEACRPPRPGDSARSLLARRLKGVVASSHVRGAMLAAVTCLERRLPAQPILFFCYRLLLGAYFSAGVRDGLRQFSIQT